MKEWTMNFPERFAPTVPKGFIPDLSKLDGMAGLPIREMAMAGAGVALGDSLPKPHSSKSHAFRPPFAPENSIA